MRRADSVEEGIRLAAQVVLVSPAFLFRIERNAAGPATPHELATRLSYFLWSSMPDEELLRAAGTGRLIEPGVLEAQVRRMLADPKATALVDNFAAQWLQLRALDRASPDPVRFPEVDEDLLGMMREETCLFARAILREDRGLLEFLDARLRS